MSGLLFRDVEVDGSITDVLVQEEHIAAIGASAGSVDAALVIDGGGGALIPALHDHHVHLLAAAAAMESVDLGPPAVNDAGQFRSALTAAVRAHPGERIRGVGYHESVAGELDASMLDAIAPEQPVRVQHRSGALWIVNSVALRALGIDEPSGRLFGQDELIRDMIAADTPPSLAAVGKRLAGYGVAGVTDATPSVDVASIEILARAARAGVLPQAIAVTGAPVLASAPAVDGVTWGPVKFVLADHALPSFEETRTAIEIAHAHGRPIAIHCVTATALALALAAWRASGVLVGDRIEHGALISLAAAEVIAELGLTVVTQPVFVAERGDEYRVDVPEPELDDLYRCGSLLAGGVRVGGSTDAPFGSLDPWASITAAVERRTRGGCTLGEDERLAPRDALALFLAPLSDPGGAIRRVVPDSVADVCLLDAPLATALADPSARHVAVTVARGRVVHHA